ncbi:Cysteine-rich secretory family protein [Candida albicans]|uniref:Cysteine-rich secretory family protein n=1 Tax=Candida albicans TaxID=5476 RepID=A0A8H6BSA6_CANAX|nr:Cysteine-rich secretory family protein [Candida albicans]
MKFLQSFPVILAVFSFAANLVSSKLVYEYETKYVTVEIVTIVSGETTYTTERLETNGPTSTTTTIVIPSSKPSSPESKPKSDSQPMFQSPSPVQITPSTTSINNAPSPTKPETTVTASPAVKAAITPSAPKPQPQPQPQENNSGTNDDSQLSSFSRQILEAHNIKRASHGVNPLTWSNELYNYANKVASSYDCSGNLRHTSGPYGENLALGYSSGANAVSAWYSEGFNFGGAGKLNHFTQVVWKSTTQLGCAYKDCRAKGWGLYIICNYQKPGNIIGQELANILPLIRS